MASTGVPSQSRSAAKGESQADRLVWLYRGVWLWMVVSLIRPQSLIPPLSALPLGVIAMLILIFAVAKVKDFRPLQDTLSKLQIALICVIVLGVFKAVNTYWLFQYFVSVLTYFLVFYMAMPLIMEVEKYRVKFLKLLFVSYTVIALWVMTHDGHGQGAFLGDENDAALALGVGFGFCFPLVKHLPTRLWRGFGYIVLVLCVIGVIASDSRGGFLGLLGALLAVIIFSGKLFKTMAVIAVLALVAYPLIPDSYLKEMNTMSDPNDSTRVQRLYMWRIGVQEYLSNPVLGVGAGNYSYRVADYENTPFVQKANIFNRSFGGRSVHSTYFQILPELGTGGAVIFISMAVIVLSRGFFTKRYRQTSDPLDVAIAQGAAAGMIPFLVAGAFVSAAYYPHFWMLCGFSASLSLRRVVQGRRGPRAAVSRDLHPARGEAGRV